MAAFDDMPDDSAHGLEGFGVGPTGINDVVRGEQPEEQEAPPHPLADYWAALTGADLASAILEREKECHAVIRDSTLVNLWRIAHAALFNKDPSNPSQFDGQQIGIEGPHGDQLRFRVAEPASYLEQQVTMATGQRAAFQAVALNTDSSSLAMAPVVDAAVDYFHKLEMPDSKERELVTSDRAYGAGYVFWRWDKWSGEDVKLGVEQVPAQVPDPADATGKTMMPSPDGATVPVDVFGPGGAPVAGIYHPWDEFHDPNQRVRHLWRGIRERRQRHELMAFYPDKAEEIRGLKGHTSEIEDQIFGSRARWGEDDLVVRHVVHVPIGDPNDKQNPLRAGRYVCTVENVVLHDARLPVSRKCGLPIVEMMSLRMHDSSFGYARWWDVLACQQAEDQVISDTLSNVATFGRLNMFYDEGTEIDMDAIAAGGGAFQKPIGSGMPGFMPPAPMPHAAEWLVTYTKQGKQSITGLNAVQRGEPGPNITSGEMAALFTNLAVEFNSATQMVLDECRRASGNIIADLILLNAENDLLIEVAGQDERPYITLFRADHLKGIRKISLDTAPPMMRSAAGRMQVFNLLEKIPEDKRGAAIMLLTTGQWRQLAQTDSASWLRIKWENEQLAQGQKVTVSATDNPGKDLGMHVDLYNQLAQNPQANAKPIAAVLAHIQEHLAQYYRMDPMLAALLKIPPPPPPPGAGAPAGSAQVPQKPGDQGPAVPTGEGSAAPTDRLGSKIPQPAEPPKGAAA